MPELQRRGGVYLLDLGDDEDRFSLEWMKSVSVLLNEVTKLP
jgi:hypothetical protein